MRRWLVAALLGVAVIVALDRAFPPDLSRASVVSAELHARDGRLLAVRPLADGSWRLRTSVADVPPELVAMLIVREDRRFRFHPGIDPIALARATAQLVATGRVVSGGSTITMQVARLLDPRPRTPVAKLLQMARAVQIETRLTKDEILALWLTLAPMGGPIEGVRAGALAWFGKPASALERAEAALLVALPQRPSTLRPDRHPGRAAVARDRVLAAAGFAPDLAGVPPERHAMPAVARHLAARLGPAAIARSTLELPLQTAIQRLSQRRGEALGAGGNLAILVVENRTREVVASFGGLAGEARAGTIDLTRAVRSPGSALKPLLFALAFDQGLLRPDTRISDLPRRFGSYAPENFDRGFVGDVTAAHALSQSLNLPSVAVAETVGAASFVAALKAAGVTPRLPPGGAGPSLPVALGGIGVTLVELTGLAAALADGGEAAPLAWREGEVARRSPLVSPAAAGAVGVILATAQPPPGIPAPRAAPTIAWKTGTSWGNRDAWAIGWTATHTIGVWVGRPDGSPVPGATGRGTAAPILFEIAGLLPDPGPLPTPPPLPPAPALARLGEARADALRLVFPPAGAVLDGAGAITLRAQGGQRPLTWLVDGAPVPAERHRREASWQPAAPGRYRVTVLDAEGRAAGVEVRVR